MISSGEKACKWTPGTSALMADAIVSYRWGGMEGAKPACTHTSVAPRSTASLARRTISGKGRKYASVSTPVLENAQNPHRFTHEFVKLMFRLMTYPT